MFNKAYNIANKYTHPLIVAMRFYDNTVDSGLGSFVVLNNEGWVITAAHNLGAAFAFNQHKDEMKIHEQNKDQNTSLIPNSKWITDFAILLSGQKINIIESHIYQEHDLAFLRIDPQILHGQTIFPKIKKANNISPGTSLCKLGFPFVEVRATFNPSTKDFTLPPNLLPIPLFPIEGIYTRNMKMGKSKDGTMDVLFLETSSPGLKGQSGGPIFDVEGNIYAIQSQNVTLPLGFKGTIEVNGQVIEENQFFNVGIGVHPFTIETLLNKHQIKYQSAE
ncbi:MAG: serine protease [Bacteroidota bacterium]|nr:serine protease [Bacteroidota bacterium]